MNKVTGDETYVHIFAKEIMDNKIWTTKNAHRSVFVKRTLSAKKVMLAVFFDINGHVVLASVPRGRPVAGTFYQHRILGKLYKYLNNVDQRQCLEELVYYHDKALAHTSSVVTVFGNEKGDSAYPSTLIARPGICGPFSVPKN